MTSLDPIIGSRTGAKLLGTIDLAGEKGALRRSLLARRRAISPAEWRARSDRICQVIATMALFQRAETVLAFFAVRQEPDLELLWGSGAGSSKDWGFPRCVGQALDWRAWRPGEGVVTGAFGIQEPTQIAPVINPAEADLILVPAVGCDRQGNRLGYGGGFYDRLLSRADCQDIPTLGIVFDFALVEQLPVEPWDCPLTAICTERGYSIVGSR